MPKKKVDAGYVSATYKAPKVRRYVLVELQHDSCVAYSPRGFAAPAAAERGAAALNRVLEGYRIGRMRSHFGMPAKAIRRRATAAAPSLRHTVSADFAQAGFVEVVPTNPRDCERLASRFNRLNSVWNAVVAPEPVPAVAPEGSSSVSRNFEPAQGYLHSPPNGIGAIEAWKLKGGDGRKITICDIEGNWNRRHEDLPTIKVFGGTMLPGVDWKNHGTAVLGEMVSRPSTSGTAGIAHRARAAVHSAVISGVWNTAGAILNATKKLKKGDVILIELQGTGPNGKYVAMQYWNDVFSAIRTATAKGITVVEAAGNGNENFQLPIFNNTGLQKDSGAIVVGAGVPPTNYFDQFGPSWGFPKYGKIGVPRSRIWFSNYGKIVNVHGWGWHVTTLGYGDAQGGGSQNRWYTHRFSGTSSASPIVAAAVACIQGRAKAKLGTPLTPAKVRALLMKTGTPQVAGPSVPLSQRIGPLVNLERAIKNV